MDDAAGVGVPERICHLAGVVDCLRLGEGSRSEPVGKRATRSALHDDGLESAGLSAGMHRDDIRIPEPGDNFSFVLEAGATYSPRGTTYAAG